MEDVRELLRAAAEIIVDDDTLTITINGLEYNKSYNTYVVKMDIQNNSSKTIEYSLDWVNVNGYTLSALLFGDVYGGMSANADFGFPADEMNDAGIQNIQEISFELLCKDADTDTEIYKLSPTLKTSDFGETEQSFDFSGEEIYNDGNYRICIKPNSTPSINHPVVIYVENNTDTSMILMYDNVAINNQMILSLQSGPYVLPHSHRVETTTLNFLDKTPDVGDLVSFTSGFSIQPYYADGGFSTADLIEVPAATIPLL